jgi:hypothetical protein
VPGPPAGVTAAARVAAALSVEIDELFGKKTIVVGRGTTGLSTAAVLPTTLMSPV